MRVGLLTDVSLDNFHVSEEVRHERYVGGGACSQLLVQRIACGGIVSVLLIKPCGGIVIRRRKWLPGASTQMAELSRT